MKVDIGSTEAGHFYQLLDKNEQPMGPIVGPFSSEGDAIEAAQDAIDKHDGWINWPAASNTVN